MKIRQALKLGLIKVGSRIKSNGAWDSSLSKDVFFCGVICYIQDTHFGVERDDQQTGSGLGFAWRIKLNNTRATIEFNSTEEIVTIVKYYTINLAKCKCKDGKVVFVKFKNRRKRSLKKEHTINIVHTSTCLVEI